MFLFEMSTTFSVNEGIKEIVDKVDRRSNNRRSNVARFYETLLTKSGNEDDDNIVRLNMEDVVCFLRIIQHDDANATKVETLIDRLNVTTKDSCDLAASILRFLANLNQLSSTSVKVSEVSKCRSHLKLTSISELDVSKKPQIINLDVILLNDVPILEKALNTNNFPLLPSLKCKDVDDEGYVEGCLSARAHSDSECNVNFPNNKKRSIGSKRSKTLWSQKEAILNDDVNNEYLSANKVQYVTEQKAGNFNDFYLQKFMRPIHIVAGCRLNVDSVDQRANEIQFEYFKRCVNNLIVGIESDVFPYDQNKKCFLLRDNICLVDISAESTAAITAPLLEAGKNFFNICGRLNSLYDKQKLTSVLRAYFVAVRSEVEHFQTQFVPICSNSTVCLDLLEKLKPFTEALNCLEKLFRILDEKLKADSAHVGDISIWLVDTLFDLCTSFEFYDHNSVFVRLFKHVFLAYFSFIERWIDFAVLEFSSEEFFVQLNETYFTCRDRDFWKLSFNFVENHVPVCIRHQAFRIFTAGKLLSVMKTTSDTIQILLCNESTVRLNKKFTILPCQKDEGKSLSILVDDEISVFKFEEMLNAYLIPKMKIVEDRFRRFMFVDCKLLETLSALRDLYLGGNGFFSTSVSDLLFPVLLNVIANYEETPSLTYPTILSAALDDSVEISGIDRTLLKSISLVFVKSDKDVNMNNTNFFNVLDLHCEIPWPCNLIVSESSVKWLKKVFRFLTCIRWTIWCLNDVWNYLKTANMENPHLNVHKLLLHQREMKHFVFQLEVYVLHQIVGVCWTDFTSELNKTDDFEEMFACHNSYINTIAIRCLLNPKAQPVYDSIVRLLECALTFRQRIVADECESKAFSVFTEFRSRATALMTIVEKLASRGYQPHLTELLLRLNFNEFYFKNL